MSKKTIYFFLLSHLLNQKRDNLLYVGRMGSNNNAKFLSLFNFLDKLEKYSESAILEKGIVTKQQLSNLKAHLYKQILISLRLNPIHQNIRMQIREQMDFAVILYQKGLYKLSLKILDKAKALSLKNEEKYAAYDIVEFEKLIESQYITRSLSNRAQELISQADSLRTHNDLTSQLSNLSLLLYQKLIKTGYAKSDLEFREITKFFYEKMPNLIIENLGFREKLWYYKAHVWYSFLVQDFLSCFKYSSKWITMFDENPDMISIHPVFYLKGNNFLMESLALIKYPEKFKQTLQKMLDTIESDIFPKNDNLAALSFLYSYNNRFNYYFLQGKFDVGLKILPDVLEGINNFKNQIDPHHIMLFYYKIACLYFGLEDYEKCIIYLNKIIKNKHLKMREDLLCFTRVLSVVAHYEAGFDYHLDAHLRDTYKFLIKMNDLHEVQKAMIRFVRSLGNIYPHELKDSFVKLHKELKQYEDDPYERRAFLYLDILSWLESKIENRPVGEIIREKAKVINRKERSSIEV